MKIIHSMGSVRQTVLGWRRAERRVGLVPTMGALHEGHASLIRRARRENDEVVVSIFVNPVQFGPGEDFSRYPRPFVRDAALCRREGVSVLFAPKPSALYSTDHQTWVTVEKLAGPLCGPFRPGHFRGVATVVLKLFNMVQPDRAYFGKKDFQQLRVIEQMVNDLNVPVKIVPCPTVRDPSGLALSSRNAYLSPDERAAAPRLRRALRTAGQVLKSRRNVREAQRAARNELRQVPGARIQYLEILDPKTLSVPKKTGPFLLAAAVYVGRTRLIDNLLVRGAL
ncbi:MAG: pantoate--beta-alanine ligase [Elusimicrobia bacterium]|nr:pantoate--beta-alanine ligase [Elusimicrobiota bacterium]